jgi:hypothetical protein
MVVFWLLAVHGFMVWRVGFFGRKLNASTPAATMHVGVMTL